MGFLKNVAKAIKETSASRSQKPDSQSIRLVFGLDYMEKAEEIGESIRRGTWRGGNSIEVDFDQDLLREIKDCVETHSGTARVLYSDDMQFLDVVGEGFRQEDLRKLYNEVQESWLSGVLMPEPLNPFDVNAVSVLVIQQVSNSMNLGNELNVIHAGHLKKEQASRVSPKLINLAKSNQYVPILCKLVGGTLDKPNLGLLARAKTNQVRF
jgi:hypothetical protein